MRRLIRAAAAAACLLVQPGCAALASETEEPSYRLEAQEGDFEIRVYAPMIVAETEVEGPRDRAIGAGFRILADYIFGNNEARGEIAMTAPVTQAPSETIAMTAPVTQTGDGGRWTVGFVMPRAYTLETLPRPKDPRVAIRAVPERRVAVVRFSWTGGAGRVEAQTRRLMDFVESRGLVGTGRPGSAFYDPPWTPPFLRRNEVWIEVAPRAAGINP